MKMAKMEPTSQERIAVAGPPVERGKAIVAGMEPVTPRREMA
jgi:hypothetical protein